MKVQDKVSFVYDHNAKYIDFSMNVDCQGRFSFGMDCKAFSKTIIW
jgi:hypothetical protein